MANRYPLSALAFPCVTMLWLSSQMTVPLTTAADGKHMAILGNVNCTLPSRCVTDRKDTDKFYRLVVIAETIMEVTRPNNSNRLRNISNNYNNRRDRNVLYPETPGGTLTGTITPGQSGPGSNGNEAVFNTPQNSRTGASPSNSVNTTNSSIMLFRMDEQVFTGEEVTSAVLKIYIKTKGKRRRRRIILHVSENTEDGKLAEFATIKLRVKRKGWQKINLPVYLLNKLQHQPIKLHVGCEKCNKKVRVVLPLKKSKKSQEFRDLGSRKRRSPIIVLNTKPNSAAAAAAVAAVVATRHLRRPRRDLFRLRSRSPFPETAGSGVEQTVSQINTDSPSSKQFRPSPINVGSVDKSLTIAPRKDRNVKDTDEGVRNTPKRRETTCTESGVTEVNNNVKNENNTPARNNYDDSAADDGDDNDDDGDYDNSSFEYDDDDDVDDDSDDNEKEEEEYGEKVQGYGNTMGKYESEKDEGEGLSKGCCMTSRFVSFKSIGLSGLVVRPRLGFVSNHCSDLCPIDRPQPTAKADGENREAVAATRENKHATSFYESKPPEFGVISPTQYTYQPKTWLHPPEETNKKSLLAKLTSSPNSKSKPLRPSFTLLSHLHQTKSNHRFRDRNKSIHLMHRNGDRERQDNYNKHRRNRKGDKNSDSSSKRSNGGRDIYKKNIPPQRLCRPVEYKNLKLSFITADMKVEKMTLPNAIVSKCGYV